VVYLVELTLVIGAIGVLGGRDGGRRTLAVGLFANSLMWAVGVALMLWYVEAPWDVPAFFWQAFRGLVYCGLWSLFPATYLAATAGSRATGG